MKPIVILVGNSADKITLTTEELKKYIEDAYNQGYADRISSLNSSFTPHYRDISREVTVKCCDADKASSNNEERILRDSIKRRDGIPFSMRIHEAAQEAQIASSKAEDIFGDPKFIKVDKSKFILK